MNQLKTFDHNQFGKLEVLVVNEKEYFPANDVAKKLGYSNTHDAINRHCRNKGVVFHEVLTPGGKQQKKFIDEGNLYRLITNSKLPQSEQFESWVFDEVLPTIRKTGSYSLDVDVTQLSPELQIMNNMVRALAKQELEQKQMKRELNETKQEIEEVRKVFILNPKNWRKEVNELIIKISQTKNTLDAYKDTRNESYKRLEERARCNLDIRLENKRERMRKSGSSKTAINRINKMDVIADDPRLMEIYLTVVKEMAIRHQINVPKREGAI